MTTPHPDWPSLNDYADGTLSSARRDDIANHVTACDTCRADLARLERVRVATNAAPRAVEPPAHAWDGIRSAIEARKVATLPVPAAARRGSRAWMAAAAVALIAASSAITTVIVRRGAPAGSAVAARPVEPTAARLVSLPDDLAAAERGYLDTVGELQATLDAARTTLAPETVAAVERSLRVIDDAIAEAREALLGDPANMTVRDLLRKGYEQKVDLLRRATARLLET